MPKSKNIGRSILLAIIITVLSVFFVNVGVSYFYEQKNYDEFCDINPYPMPPYRDGTSNPINENCPDPYSSNESIQCQQNKGQPIFKIENNCNVFDKCDYCNEEYQNYQKEYNLRIFFIFAVLGILLMLFGLIAPVNLLIELTTLATGFILTVEGLIRNRENKLAVLLTLGLLILLVIWFALKKIKKNSD